MNARINKNNANLNGLGDSEADYASCVQGAYYLVNYTAKDANGNYPCRDFKKPCYTIDDVENVIYIYNHFVKNNSIPVYDPANNPSMKPTIISRVAMSANMEEGRVAAILFNLWQGVQDGAIEETVCLDPLSSPTQAWIYILIAAGLMGGGYFLIKRTGLGQKATVKLKNKFKRKK